MTRSLPAVCSALIVLVVSAASCAGPGAADSRPSPAADLVHHVDEAQVVEHPWGWIRWVMSSQVDPDAEMTFGLVQLDPEQSNPTHVHMGCEEHLYVISGSCEHRIGDEWVTLKEGDLVRIPAGVPHAARTAAEPMCAVIVYSAGERDFREVTAEAAAPEY